MQQIKKIYYSIKHNIQVFGCHVKQMIWDFFQNKCFDINHQMNSVIGRYCCGL